MELSFVYQELYDLQRDVVDMYRLSGKTRLEWQCCKNGGLRNGKKLMTEVFYGRRKVGIGTGEVGRKKHPWDREFDFCRSTGGQPRLGSGLLRK